MNVLRSSLLVLVVASLLSACVSTTGKPNVVLDKRSAAETRIQLGMKYLQAGNRDNARRQFMSALKLDKNAVNAHQGIALVHQLNGEHDLAEKNFKKALKIRTKEPLAPTRYAYARFLLKQGRTEEAMKTFETVALNLDFARRSQAIYFVGQCAEKLNNVERAKSAYQHSINLDPKMAASMIALSEISFREGDYGRAKRLLDTFSKVTRPTAQSLWLGVRIERIFGNKDKEASYALMLKNMHPYSKEYLEFKKTVTNP